MPPRDPGSIGYTFFLQDIYTDIARPGSDGGLGEEECTHILRGFIHMRGAIWYGETLDQQHFGLTGAKGCYIARYPRGAQSIIMHMILLKFLVFVQFHHFILIHGVMLLCTAYLRFIEYLLHTVSIIYASI